jgi:hypothetical protein
MSASRQELTVSSKSSSTKLEHDEYCLPLQLRASCQMFCHGVCEPNDCSCGQAAASACNARTQQARQPSRASLPACGGLQLKRNVSSDPAVHARISYPYRSYITMYIPKTHSRLGRGGVSIHHSEKSMWTRGGKRKSCWDGARTYVQKGARQLSRNPPLWPLLWGPVWHTSHKSAAVAVRRAAVGCFNRLYCFMRIVGVGAVLY